MQGTCTAPQPSPAQPSPAQPSPQLIKPAQFHCHQLITIPWTYCDPQRPQSTLLKHLDTRGPPTHTVICSTVCSYNFKANEIITPIPCNSLYHIFFMQTPGCILMSLPIRVVPELALYVPQRRGGFGMTPWCVVLVCSWRRILADRHSLPFPWTFSLHGQWCPSASHHPMTLLFLPALTFPLYFPFLSLPP